MKKTNVLMSSLIVIALLIVGCSDDDSNCTQDLTGELSNDETAFAHKWVLAEIVSEKEIDLTDDSEDNPNTNLFEQYEACEKDAFYNFNNDRSYTFEQGVTASNCSNKQTSTGTWKLTNNTLLTLVSFCNMREIDIEMNTDGTSFLIEDNFNVTDVNGNRINSNITFTYNKVAI
ncbi:DUF5004 domain-containing protein [Flavivirga abyssicola]|uniref:DUF5004 domain-containing protein n=1 Tax=Flavivirga abyssicola TaxID=3063533 RepID=UPI0026E08537|nr:DUF5004 domain-containing protein [Flavivirga sp. MEBiC07777]WVK11581.1 DUF5004 domain-containing protein [Flavivirga sp. MEBiC07777]